MRCETAKLEFYARRFSKKAISPKMEHL